MLGMVLIAGCAGLVAWAWFSRKAQERKNLEVAQLRALNSVMNKIRRDDGV